MGIVGDAGLELAGTLSERLDVRIPGLDALKAGDKVVDAGQDRTDVAVPQEPLDASLRPVDSFRFLPVVVMGGKALGALPQHRDAHGDVEPVEHVLGAGRHEFRHAADAVLAVSQERDLLVHLQALFLQCIVQSAPGFSVKALHKAEAWVFPVLRDGLSNHDLEVCQPSLTILLTGTNITSVDSDNDRAFGRRQRSMVSWRAFDETEPLLPQFPFHAVRHMVEVVAHGPSALSVAPTGSTSLSRPTVASKETREAHFVSR